MQLEIKQQCNMKCKTVTIHNIRHKRKGKHNTQLLSAKALKSAAKGVLDKWSSR